jgi:hypothetical protein
MIDFGFNLDAPPPVIPDNAPCPAPSYDRLCCFDDSVDAPCWGCQSVRQREAAEIVRAYERGVLERRKERRAAAELRLARRWRARLRAHNLSVIQRHLEYRLVEKMKSDAAARPPFRVRIGRITPILAEPFGP